MSKTYIRIYCNGNKVRSTGSVKWYRQHVLQDLLLDEDLKTVIPEKHLEKRLEIFKNNLKRYSFYGGDCDKYLFSVHLVRTNTLGKFILNEQVLPWVLHKDGSITVLEPWERRMYEIKNPGIFWFSQIKFHTPGYCEQSLQKTDVTD